MTRGTNLGLVGVVLFALSGYVQAAVIDLAPPPSSYTGQFFNGGWFGGTGNRRSFIFEDDTAFNLNSVGIEFNPSSTTTLTLQLYQIIGTDTVGSLLGTSSTVVPDLGRGFYDVALSHSFAGTDSRYLLDFSWIPQATEATFYDFEGLGDGGAPIDPSYTVGPFRVIDGKDGSAVGTDNFVLSHFRADIDAAAVPEPSSLALFAIGGIGVVMGAVRRRRHKQPA